MDNFAINVTARGRESLRLALALAFENNAPGKKATHWVEVPGVGIVLMWHADKLHYSRDSEGELIPNDERYTRTDEVDESKSGVAQSSRFIAPLSAETAVGTVWNWLESLEDKDYYGSLNDCDVTERRAWRVYCENWGHVQGSSYAICAIQPVWAWLGK